VRDITIYPDHQNKNIYYYVPQAMTLTQDANGIPYISYMEYHQSFWEPRALLQMTLTATYNTDLLKEAQKRIKKRRPKAKFIPIMPLQSRMYFGNVLDDLIIQQLCDRPAGTFGTEVACAITLNEKGQKILRNSLRKRVSMVLNFEYTVKGCFKTFTSSCKPVTINYGVAARIGGQYLKDFPFLFVDEKGKPIPLKKNSRNEWDEDWAYDD
ncbi:MAG: hypothetical protein D6797_08360, partial [Bdellovibrio sp.]